jgi:hypothetical protein
MSWKDLSDDTKVLIMIGVSFVALCIASVFAYCCLKKCGKNSQAVQDSQDGVPGVNYSVNGDNARINHGNNSTDTESRAPFSPYSSNPNPNFVPGRSSGNFRQ